MAVPAGALDETERRRQIFCLRLSVSQNILDGPAMCNLQDRPIREENKKDIEKTKTVFSITGFRQFLW